jgi:hypothetical protein
MFTITENDLHQLKLSQLKYLAYDKHVSLCETHTMVPIALVNTRVTVWIYICITGHSYLWNIYNTFNASYLKMNWYGWNMM